VSGLNLGLPNFNFGNVTLIPNPAVDDVFVTWSPSSSVKVIHVYSIRGELLQQNNDVQNVSEVRISLRTMVSGVYFVQLVSAEGMIATQKLIIK
jgi:hypothetical protein